MLASYGGALAGSRRALRLKVRLSRWKNDLGCRFDKLFQFDQAGRMRVDEVVVEESS